MRVKAFLTALLMLIALPGLGLGEMCGEQSCCEAPMVGSPMDCCTIGQAPEPVASSSVTTLSAKTPASKMLISRSEASPAESGPRVVQAAVLPGESASPPSCRERLAVLSILLI